MENTSRLILKRTEAPKQLRRYDLTLSPILKWAGGKTKLLQELLIRAPAKFQRYFEPFFGGGALFFHLCPHRAILSDVNSELMNVYRCVAWRVDAVIKKLEIHRKRHSHDYYYQTRERWNSQGSQSAVERAAAFLYLNKTCYNGLYRVNQKGKFNVPIGRYTSPRIYDAEHLRTASQVLRGAKLASAHFADVTDSARAGDFVYFDPPYVPMTKTANFTSYTAANFGDRDQRDLAEVMRALTEKGVNVMVSNSDTPLIRDLYREFNIAEVKAPRAINSKGHARGRVGELIITNGYA